MEVKVCNNYEEMSAYAAKIIASQIILKPNSIIGLATGSTPIGTYKELIKMNKEQTVDFKDVTTFNLDEYYPIKQTNDQSYKYFMDVNLFDHININKENTHIPNGETTDPTFECQKYDKMIEEAGGIDLQILGIGQNGHIGFNEPDEFLSPETHVTDLTQNTIEANARFFKDISEVPTKALTMGMGTIMKSKKIIVLANGKNKHDIVNQLINGKISTNIPASLLKVHSDVTLICDKEAYSSMHLGFDIGGTSIKYGVVDSKKNIIEKGQIPTQQHNGAEGILDEIIALTKNIQKTHPIVSVGIGTAGTVDAETKTVTASNLPFKNTPVENYIKEKIEIPVSVENDANSAALGEALAGVAQNVDNVLMVTLGTGIGGGIIINKKIYSGTNGEAGEIGHMSINADGLSCPCGNIGCWERYASVTALIEQTKKAAEENPDSILAKKIASKNGTVTGRTVFDAMNDECDVAKDVFDKYINYLSVGLKSIINIFKPGLVVLAGGITVQGDTILNPLLKQLNSTTPVKISRLQNDAGIVGAAMLYKSKK